MGLNIEQEMRILTILNNKESLMNEQIFITTIVQLASCLFINIDSNVKYFYKYNTRKSVYR
ncbi:hypothetical protein THOM_1502 [Trachipleistophora hominis]|uniref:Uncharacterized protein n=1 Tax=Trachipleistophora hominis TaxID=72359 RepID=L7JVU0_TRAHO|nr:hypothetical protein THOM_1502 [Trachipleistophora hominis]